MIVKTHSINMSADQIRLLVRVVSTHVEMCQQDLSDAIFQDDSGAVSDAEASLRALDSVLKALKILG
jgi:hypothetical protein